jgi:hypothetical protein
MEQARLEGHSSATERQTASAQIRGYGMGPTEHSPPDDWGATTERRLLGGNRPRRRWRSPGQTAAARPLSTRWVISEHATPRGHGVKGPMRCAGRTGEREQEAFDGSFCLSARQISTRPSRLFSMRRTLFECGRRTSPASAAARSAVSCMPLLDAVHSTPVNHLHPLRTSSPSVDLP